ncbi:MAG: DUF6115 domain-containing protein [Lachnospiraceae bacterium]
MTALEIVLIIIGLIFVLGSFMVAEKLSGKELTELAKMSSNEINKIIEKELEKANVTISNTVDDVIDESVMKVERMMDKETNAKIMAISEYSDSVLNSISKTHNEVMFLYSMLNDKHEELTTFANELSEVQSRIQKLKEEMECKIEEVSNRMEQESCEISKTENSLEDNVFQGEPEQQELQSGNHNNEILELYRSGMSTVEIARKLSIGFGEVKFVIDLYRGED